MCRQQVSLDCLALVLYILLLIHILPLRTLPPSPHLQRVDARILIELPAAGTGWDDCGLVPLLRAGAILAFPLTPLPACRHPRGTIFMARLHLWQRKELTDSEVDSNEISSLCERAHARHRAWC